MSALVRRLPPLTLAACIAAHVGLATPAAAEVSAQTQGSNPGSATRARGIACRDMFGYGLTVGLSRGYGQTGFLAGPFAEYRPLSWLGLRLTGCYENDIYLFFKHYRVNGALLNADVCLRYRRFSASLGPTMDYYFAPVVDKRIWGWHAGVGLQIVRFSQFSADVAVGYANRVDPWLYQRSWLGHEWGYDWPPHPCEVLLRNMPRAYCMLRFAWPRAGGG